MTGTRTRAQAAAIEAARSARDPEGAIRAPMAILRDALGDDQAHLRPGALAPGQVQFRVAGGFLVTPDRDWLFLTGNSGFPPEQERLCVPIGGGDPGRVIASGRPLLLADTRAHGGFRQYLKTARMGSAAYAPLCRGDDTLGLIIVAALAAGTLGPKDLAVLTALAPAIAAAWDALDGPGWLAAEYAAARDTGRAHFASPEGAAS